MELAEDSFGRCRITLQSSTNLKKKMNPSQLPLNQVVELFQDGVVRATITRTSDTQVKMCYYSQVNSDLVLKMVAPIDGVSPPPVLDLAGLDTVFWSITVDGHPATRRDLEDVVTRTSNSFSVDAKSRTVAFHKPT